MASCAVRSHVVSRGNLEITSKFKEWNWGISTGRTVGYLASVGMKTDGCVCSCMLTMHSDNEIAVMYCTFFSFSFVYVDVVCTRCRVSSCETRHQHLADII